MDMIQYYNCTPCRHRPLESRSLYLRAGFAFDRPSFRVELVFAVLIRPVFALVAPFRNHVEELEKIS